jgi:hypothetical protein
MSNLPAAPGDVLAVWTGDGPLQDLIRVGEVLDGLPAVANHVVIITHQDQVGRWIGIQGQPGGVGPVDCTPFLSDARTMSTHPDFGIERQCEPADWWRWAEIGGWSVDAG